MHIQVSRVIADLKLITPDIHYDYRGEYVETFSRRGYDFHDAAGQPIEFVEDDISVSRRHVLRGLHGDSRTWKLIQCLQGEFYYVVADLRRGSPSYRRWESFILNDRNRRQVLVPAGCANGHLVLSDTCIFSYKQSQYYSGAHDQFTVRWNDPFLNIHWPIQNPLLSERDSTAPLLVE
ncbi:MAG: dTDP-4-dehydrorhamnose 3,5-epimerase family protein [Anaerolineales bacterium]|nr:dTDP-4-dehydrorhamnose 3,5-epimerase family protein [Anaerolineales bacterium]